MASWGYASATIKKKRKKLLHYVVFFEIMVFGNNQSINAHNQLGNEKKKIWIDFTESINKKNLA